MTPYILIITLIAHDPPQSSHIEIGAGIMATPELCHMAGKAIAEQIDNDKIKTSYRCVKAPEGVGL